MDQVENLEEVDNHGWKDQLSVIYLFFLNKIQALE